MGKGNGHALSRAEQLQVCIWYAELNEPPDIVNLIQEKFGKKVVLNTAWHYRTHPKWRRLTRYLRRRLVRSLLIIPIANKDVRLRRLEKIYRQAMTEHVVSISKGGEEILGIDLHAATTALRDARKEIEGDKPTVNQTILDQSDRSLHLTTIANLAEAAKAAWEASQNRIEKMLEPAGATNGDAPTNGDKP